MKKPDNVDQYIEHSPEEGRETLKVLRETIRAAAPSANEGIWYGVPFYEYHGELVGFSVYTQHVSFGFGSHLEDEVRTTLEKDGYKLGKQTLQIRFDQEVPVALITKIVKAKAAANEKSPGATVNLK